MVEKYPKGGQTMAADHSAAAGAASAPLFIQISSEYATRSQCRAVINSVQIIGGKKVFAGYIQYAAETYAPMHWLEDGRAYGFFSGILRGKFDLAGPWTHELFIAAQKRFNGRESGRDNSPIVPNFCPKKLSAFRQKKKLSQNHISTILSTSQQRYWALENGKTPMREKFLQKIISTFDVSAETFLDENAAESGQAVTTGGMRAAA